MNADEPTNQPPNPMAKNDQLQARKVIAGAIMYVISQRNLFLKTLLVPGCVLIGIAVLTDTLATQQSPLLLVLFTANLLVQTIFAVISHRLTLIGSTAVGSWFSFDWSRRESLFLLRVLACAFLTGIPAAFALSIPNVGIPIAILLAIILITRLSLIFPATAMNHQTSISQAWQMSRRHQIPLFGIVVLFPLIFVLLPAWLLSQLPYATILSSLLSMVGTIFTLAAVSLAYREVIRIDKIQSVSIT